VNARPITIQDLTPIVLFIQHLKVLEDSGLISSHKKGRVRTCQVAPSTLVEAEQWMLQLRHYWGERLDALASYVELDD